MKDHHSMNQALAMLYLDAEDRDRKAEIKRVRNELQEALRDLASSDSRSNIARVIGLWSRAEKLLAFRPKDKEVA